MDQYTVELKLRLDKIERRLATLETLALLHAAQEQGEKTDADNPGHVSKLAAAGPERSGRQRAALR